MLLLPLVVGERCVPAWSRPWPLSGLNVTGSRCCFSCLLLLMVVEVVIVVIGLLVVEAKIESFATLFLLVRTCIFIFSSLRSIALICRLVIVFSLLGLFRCGSSDPVTLASDCASYTAGKATGST